ncbi:hypothetical protein [Vreelandella olivaria]|uniref:hypothetical protein n=1 Tax=Vreelandella olivaria TaxID=390919 RepID=UPI00201EEB08|nr:hypothetical protein [Halomonas olivaria]
MQKHVIITTISGLLLCSVLTASSAESADMTGSLDGEFREWYVLSQGSDSNASFVEVGDRLQIDITGFADPYTWDAREALAMSFIIEHDALMDAEVVHLISSTAIPPLYTSDGGDVTVSLSHIERNGPLIHIMGRIEGDLVLQEKLGAAPNPEEGISLDIQFDVEARKVEF